jgi:hypothetical protein
MESEQAGIRRTRWRWWMAVPIVIAAFAIGFGVTKIANSGDSGQTQPAPPRGIPFAQAHLVPLGITEAQLDNRVGVPPALIRHRSTDPPQTCRYYPLSDQAGRYVFCFAKGKLVVAYGGPTS